MSKRIFKKIKTFGFIFSFVSVVILSSQLMFSSPVSSKVAGCGPQDSAIASTAAKFFIFPYGDVFLPACQEHDKCYFLNTSGKTKTQCEQEFRQNLYKACNDRSLTEKLSNDFLGYITNPKLWGTASPISACEKQANYAVWAVTTFGESSVVGAVHSLKVKKVEVMRIDDTFSDDELRVCVTVQNDGNIDTEWDLVLLGKGTSIVDTEPDVYERNIAIGKTDKECVTTNNIPQSVSDLRSPANVVVRLDDVVGAAPLTPVANIKVPTNLKPYDKFNVIKFEQPSRWESFKTLQESKKGK